MNGKIFILGAAITDLTGFPLGRPQPSDSVPGSIQRSPGGVGRNIAENLVALGLQVELVTAFGDDHNGQQLLRHCQDKGIGIRHSLQVERTPGAVHLAIMDEQADLYAGLADLRVMDFLTPDYLREQLAALQSADTIVLEANLPVAALAWLMEQEWEIPLYLDPVSDRLSQRVAAYLPRFHTLKLNRRQAEAICGRSLLRAEDLLQAARRWIDGGTRQVFITLGSGGVFAANDKQHCHLPAAKVKVANTTGAGDAFMAGLLWAARRQWSLEDCCRAGLAASTLSVKSAHAISPELSEAALLEHIRKFC